MEYVPLGDLCSLLRREPLSLSVKIQLLMGTAAALCHLHQENVVHRDLAARNLLVTLANGNYEVKVTDFGLSRKSKGTYESSTGFGPLKWMAPESIHPKTKLFSKASDVWAFGVVIWVTPLLSRAAMRGTSFSAVRLSTVSQEILMDGEEPFADMESIDAGMVRVAFVV